MSKVAPLPKLNDCVVTVPRPASLSDGRVSQAVLVFIAVAVLGLAHIYLRFAVRDMRTQHRQLQVQVQELRQEENSLTYSTEAMCDAATLRQQALRDMGMVEVDPRMRMVAGVSNEYRERYHGATRSPEPDVAIAVAEAEEPSAVKRVLMSLVDVNKAFADQRSK